MLVRIMAIKIKGNRSSKKKKKKKGQPHTDTAISHTVSEVPLPPTPP